MGTKLLGKTCLVLIVTSLTSFAFSTKATAQEDRISLPEMPKAKPPRNRSREEVDADIDERRQKRNKDEEKSIPAPTPSGVVRDQKLREEAVADRPMALSITASLVLSKVLTSKTRKDYSSEPSVIIHAYGRDPERAKSDDVQPFYGLRLANFTGSGVYKGIPGRFGYLYFGPMIGLGKISLGEKDLGVTSTTAARPPSSYKRSGYLVATGLALQSRFASTPIGMEPPSDDLNDKPLAFDAPGLWAEAHFLNVYYGAVAANILTGVHLGKGKIFFYLGVSTGGWY